MAPDRVELGVIKRKNLIMGAGILWAPSLYFILLLAGATYESQRSTYAGHESGDEGETG